MTELKTLKDFEIEPCGGNYCHYHNAESLKLEAIKWIKESMKCGDLNINRDLFIRFFNITEEDLK